MNIAMAIMHMYPNIVIMRDYIVQDDSDGKGPYIAFWNLDEPQPTEVELLEAWEAYQESEAIKPSEPTELDIIGRKLVERELEAAELKEQNEVLGGQIVEKELQIMDIKAQNESLGESLVGFELRLLSLETPIKEGEEANV